MANFLTDIFSRNKEKRSGLLPANYGTPYMNLFAGVGMQNKSNVVVNAETANKVSAFYSCVRNISEDIAKLPIKILKVDAQGNKVELRNHAAYKLLNLSPNEFSNPFTLIQNLLDRALRKGDGFALIIRDSNATPTKLIFLEYESVIPFIGEDWNMYYKVNDPILKIDGIFNNDDMFHLRGMGNAYRGISVLRYGSESIGAAIATQDYRGKFYGTGANMTGILKLKGLNAQDENKIIAAKQSFLNSYASDGIAAMNDGTEFVKMNFSADEAQMLGSSEFNVKDMARWFRMPLSKLQTSDNIPNPEALAIEYVTDCLMPWIVRIEQEIRTKLFTTNEQSNVIAMVNTISLTRGDSAAQERTQKTLYYTGQATINDLLKLNDMDTIGPDGDVRFYPVNMIPDYAAKGFWETKDQSKAGQSSPDSTGSGIGAIN